MTLDAQMVRAMLTLREDGANLGFVYVPGASFARESSLLPLRPVRQAGSEAATADDGLTMEARAQLMQLSTAGVRCVTLARGDNMLRTLATWESGPQGRARAAR